MTAAEWATSDDPLALVRHLRGRPQLSPSRWFRWAVGLPTPLPEQKLVQLLHAICDLPPPQYPPDDLDPLRAALTGYLAGEAATPALLTTLLRHLTGLDVTPADAHMRAVSTALADDRHNPPLADAVRCLFGDPFHPPPDPTTYRTATAVHLAQAAEATGDRGTLPVLADALEDGGCTHAGLLAHLRSGGPHRPGCHALDAVLGR